MDNYLLDLTAQLERIDYRFKWRIRELLEQDTTVRMFPQALPDTPLFLKEFLINAGAPRWAREVPGWETYDWREQIRPGSRLDLIFQNFELSAIERELLMLCLLPVLDSGYMQLIARLQGGNRAVITAELAILLLYDDIVMQNQILTCLHSGGALFSHCLLRSDISAGEGMQTRLNIDMGVCRFLLGYNDLPSELDIYARWVSPWADEVKHEFCERLAQICKVQSANERVCVVVRTPAGMNAEGGIAQILARKGKRTLLLDVSLLPADDLLACRLIAITLRETRLHGAYLLLKGAETFYDTRRKLLAFLGNCLAKHRLPVIILNPLYTAPLRLGNGAHITIEIPNSFLQSDFDLVHSKLSALGAEDGLNLASLIQRYPLQAEYLSVTLQEASLYARQRGDKNSLIGQDNLRRALSLRSQQNFGALAHRVNPVRTFDDLIVGPELKVQLKEILAAIRQREAILNRGFSHKLGQATGISALFFGDSGTGKTLAAEVLAGELGVDLIHVDLSAVINKYIGETEKHLARIFNLAEIDSGVLFFDEADALFGKRTETQDAHDRHANIEVSYLLQRLERHPGLVILSTNNRTHLDTAFNRRLTFITRFPFPDASLRERMWKTVLPSNVSLSETINFAELAQRAELTGASIRNIALLATWLAAEDNAERIENRHMEQALKRELNKLGRIYS